METTNTVKKNETKVVLQKTRLIAGPCSAETEDQVLATAKELHQMGINDFRAGIWKPRTRPNTFEGIGSIGLDWMQEVKRQTNMKLYTEVANVKHVYEALRAGIDVLWIGARTTVNPFAVQEIADALRGVKIEVLIKNPINPDLQLWLGAIERMEKAGVNKVGAIHRGFSHYGKQLYRNPPNWQIPIDLKRKLPNTELIFDPSHVAGKRELLFDLSQKALDLNFDGLIVETHIDPDKAWSDASQQINPAKLAEILSHLVIREPMSSEEQYQLNIESFRAEIDKLDEDLIDILTWRMNIVEKIGQFKRDNNVKIYQGSRWEKILEKAKHLGKSKGLSEEFIGRIFKAIHQESINHQTNVMNS